MQFKIQVVIEEKPGQTTIEEIIHLEKGCDPDNTVGLSLLESKQILQKLQQTIVLHQVESYTASNQACPCCKEKRKIKSYRTIQFRTLFGIVSIPSVRLYHCECDDASTQSFTL